MSNESFQKLEFDFTNMLSSAVGIEHGITEDDIAIHRPQLEKAFNSLKTKREKGELQFMELPYQEEIVRKILYYSKKVTSKFDNFVVLGIGGSALGTIALQTALKLPYSNLMTTKTITENIPASTRQSHYRRQQSNFQTNTFYNHPIRETHSQAHYHHNIRLFVEDNVDPTRIWNLIKILDLKKTIFNVITKSGNTPETMATFMIFRDLLIKKLGAKKYKEHIVATTDTGKGTLRKIASEEGFEIFPIPSDIGGRFSVLTPVGLLPAAVMGIRISDLLAGAAAMDERCLINKNLIENPAFCGALFQYIANTKKNKSMQVMMPYSNSLKDIADWFRQLWAESLGKKFSLDGNIVNVGQTPIKALGATDQHSQIQLYVEGPNNKTITFLEVKKFRQDMQIPNIYTNIDNLNYLCGHTLGELLSAELTATKLTLTQNQRPNSSIILPEINPHIIGQLIFALELQTAISGELYNINAFDQPGVEGGKIATAALMGKKGYEEKR